MTTIIAPATFPADGRRLVIYTLYDRRGEVGEYVLRALRGLRAHATRLVVVVNGAIETDALAQVAGICDEVIERENTGIDVGAQRDALTRIGHHVEEYDELLLTNDTWYGPLTSFDPLFEKMNSDAVHFWGMTAHAPVTPHPLTGSGSAPYHLQSHWIAVRRGMLRSATWRDYWREMPPIVDYRDAVLQHETRFTAHFSQAGFTHRAAFDTDRYPTDNASLWAPEQLMEDGCPILKRRVFFHSPLELDRHGVVGRWVRERAVREGFPESILWADLARNVQPKILNSTAGLLDVVAPVDSGAFEHARPLNVVVVAHIFYEEMTGEILDRADALPGGYDLIITTPSEAKAAAIRSTVRRRRPESRLTDVRVVASNDGRDQSAFFVGVRDILLSDRWDLIVKLHSKKTPQDGFNIGRHFAQQQFDNLLSGPGHSANLLALFQQQPELGIVYPPAIHIGYPTLGQGWWANRPGFAKLSALLGIRVPLDDSSPLAPYGSMYIARPDALRILTEHVWRYEDFGGEQQYRDGSLAHILERMPSYAAGERGYITRTVLTEDYAAISQPALEFDLDQFTALVPATADRQFALLQRAGHLGTGRARDFVRVYIRSRWPGTGARLRRVLAPVLRLRRRLRGGDAPAPWESGFARVPSQDVDASTA